MSKTNWNITGGQVSEYSRSPRGKPSSYPSKKTTVSSATPIPEESYKRLTRTPGLGESQPKRGPNILAQLESLAVNIDETSSMTSMKGMYPVE